MSSFWTGFVEGVTEQLEKKSVSERERALEILKGVIGGDIEPIPETQEPGAIPERPLITGPRRPRNIGEMLKSGFGLLGTPQQGYRRSATAGLQPIVDETGKVVGYRPKGAIFEPRGESEVKQFENALKMKVSRGEPLTREEQNYYNKFILSSLMREPYEIPPEEIPSTPLPSLPRKPSFLSPLLEPSKYIRKGLFQYEPKTTEPTPNVENIRNAYNALRASGVSAEEAKRRLGL